MDRVRVGVVGVGNMGRTYAGAIGAIEGLQLAALCTRTLDRIKDLPGEKFADHRMMIASGRADAVVIATPHWSHPTVVIDVLRAGLHVLTDKPLAVHAADGRRMLAADTDKTRRFGVIFNERTRPWTAKIRAMIQSGDLGQLRRAIWRATGTFRLAHRVQERRQQRDREGEGGGSPLTRPPMTSTSSSGSRGSRFGSRRDRPRKKHPTEVEDDVSALLEYPGGATGLFAVTTGETPGMNRVEIAGTRQARARD